MSTRTQRKEGFSSPLMDAALGDDNGDERLFATIQAVAATDEGAAAAARPPLCLDGAFWTAVLTIANAALGAGLLSIPYAFAQAGLLVGMLLTLLLVGGACVSLCVIMATMGRAQAADPGVSSFGTLVEWSCGKSASWAVEVTVILNSFGSCVGYLVLLGDVLTPLVAPALPASVRGHARTLVVLGAAAACLLLCLLRRISYLRYSAGVAVFACIFTTSMLAVQALER